MKGILGKKIGMTHIYTEQGESVPVTVIETGPCKVLSIKKPEKNSYSAIQLGFDDKKEKRATRAEMENFKKAGSAPKRFIREIRLDSTEQYKEGQEIKVDSFKEGEYVDVTGTSKGKGFQGGMKRWNWTAGKAGHGSMHHRRPGSIGASAFPSRVFRGHHMPGHLGCEKKTVQNLQIMRVDSENNLLVVKGAVAGHNNSYLTIRSAKKKPQASTEEQKSDKKEK